MKRTKVATGATAAVLPVLADGEWHTFNEIGKLLEPFILDGAKPEVAASTLVSQLDCERMGIRGRTDQQIRWRPDLYLERNAETHTRAQYKAGADSVLKALLGLRSFQQLIVQPGQQLNPAQRYWLDKALQMTKTRIAEGEE